MIITAAAGPLANVALAVLSAVALGLIARFAPGLLMSGGRVGGLSALLSLLISINVTLAIFNLIPVPPLDGSRVVDGLVPYSWRPQWESIVRIAPVLLILLVVASQRFGIISAPANMVTGWLAGLISAIRTA
jgi:Zn-dependent protease